MLIVFLYVFIITYYIYTWCVNQDYAVSIPPKVEDSRVTIIIAFKNEADNLPILLKNLAGQDYSASNVQYLFVNDHSTDESLDLIRAYPQFDLIDTNGSGKKQALISALQQAKGELIISLDADCQIGSQWLSTILSFYN